MKYTLFLYISVFALSMVPLGCGVEEPGQQGVIMPLAVGNRWTYVDSTFNYWKDPVWVYTNTWEIIGNQKIMYENDSIDVFVCRQTWRNENISTLFLRNEVDGLCIYGECGLGTYSKGYWVRYPTKVEDIWSDLPCSIISSMRCISVDTRFATPLGTFQSLVVFHESPWWQDEHRQYYAPNIGRVGTEYAADLLFSKEVLVSYHLE